MIDKKVSIVLPVYNGEDYISEAIESIINQTYSNWELIIVNDCSTDKTLDICHKFAEIDRRIKVISNEKNLKLPGTLNAGFEIVTGDYYTWTSDDNILKKNAIDMMVTVLHHNSDVAMVYADYTNIDSEGKVLNEGKLKEPECIFCGNVCGACFMYTAEIAKKVGRYDVNLFLAEDYDYWIRIYRYGRIIHIPDDLYYYRRHDGSLTETRKAVINEQTYKALEKNFLPLYVEAKKNSLVYEFFDHVLKRGENHFSETMEMLLSVDKRYEKYLKEKEKIKKKEDKNKQSTVFRRRGIF